MSTTRVEQPFVFGAANAVPQSSMLAQGQADFGMQIPQRPINEGFGRGADTFRLIPGQKAQMPQE